MDFNQWFSKRYPKLREAAEFGMLSGNELWLYEAVKEAFAAGQANPPEEQNGEEQNPLGSESTEHTGNT